jgi:hypothetical protein
LDDKKNNNREQSNRKSPHFDDLPRLRLPRTGPHMFRENKISESDLWPE